MRRRSKFGLVELVERDGLWVLLEDGQELSAMDPARPDRLVYPYLRLLAAGAGPPGRALVIGVAGGSFSRWLVGRGFEVTGVEINRTTYRIAKRHLGLRDVRVQIDDGRRFLERTRQRWDLVVLDASTEAYIPPQLLSLECFERVRHVLNDGGRAIMNSWRGAPRAADEVATWRAAFGSGWVVTDPSVTATDNRMLSTVPVDEPGLDCVEMAPGGEIRRDAPR